MSKFTISGNITGDNNHFGDIYYSNFKDFLKDSERIYSTTELELLEIIFKETSSEEERQQILTSLKGIDKECSAGNSEVFWKKITGFLQTIGKDILAGTIADILTSPDAQR